MTTAAKSTEPKIRIVRDKANKPVALVRVASNAQAIRYVVHGEYSANLATQEDMMEAVKAGLEPVTPTDNEGETE